ARLPSARNPRGTGPCPVGRRRGSIESVRRASPVIQDPEGCGRGSDVVTEDCGGAGTRPGRGAGRHGGGWTAGGYLLEGAMCGRSVCRQRISGRPPRARTVAALCEEDG